MPEEPESFEVLEWPLAGRMLVSRESSTYVHVRRGGCSINLHKGHTRSRAALHQIGGDLAGREWRQEWMGGRMGRYIRLGVGGRGIQWTMLYSSYNYDLPKINVTRNPPLTACTRAVLAFASRKGGSRAQILDGDPYCEAGP